MDAKIQSEYEAAFLHLAKVTEAIDAVEQFADRAAELAADARYEKAEARLKAAVDALHAAGGMTFEEKMRSAPPSVRYAYRRRMGTYDALAKSLSGPDAESWEVYEVETDAHMEAFGSKEQCEAYLVKADEQWHRRQANRERRATS